MTANDVVLRRPRPEDAPRAIDVLAAAQRDLNQRHGFGHIVVQPTPTYLAFATVAEPEGIWIAEQAERFLGYACAWRRAHFWYLSQLFVSPEHHGRGLGRTLLEKTLEASPGAADGQRALITFAYNVVSTALYARYGIVPREPVLRMAGARQVVRARLGTPAAEGSEAIEAASGREAIAAMRAIDEEVLGFSRDRDHEFLLEHLRSACYQSRGGAGAGAGIDGYVYVGANGMVGPLAVRSPERLAPLLGFALARATELADEITIVVPGSSAAAVSLALANGMQIVQPFVFSASRPFQATSRYLFHSPYLM